jgi:hypothetical protein
MYKSSAPRRKRHPTSDHSSVPKKLNMRAFAAILGAALPLLAYSQTAGVTTRYWDCCKGSCSWSGKASVSHPVNTCDINNSISLRHPFTFRP